MISVQFHRTAINIPHLQRAQVGPVVRGVDVDDHRPPLGRAVARLEHLLVQVDHVGRDVALGRERHAGCRSGGFC